MYQLKRGIKKYREELGKKATEGVEFTTVSELSAVMGYSKTYFKKQWLSPLTMLPPNLYSVDEFAEAWAKGTIPVNKGSRGNKALAKEGSHENE
jgi:hypothetical protein